jgi:hypothetical protein
MTSGESVKLTPVIGSNLEHGGDFVYSVAMQR